MRATLVYSLAALLALGGGDTVAAGGGKSYHLVTQTRPEHLERYFALARGAYNLCVENAKALRLPFKPFPVIPADFVTERYVYISDGKRFSLEETQFTLDYDEMAHTTGCGAQLESRAERTVFTNGKSVTSYRDRNGVVSVDQVQPSSRDPASAGILALYSVPKTVKGVALKCHPDNSCIVDPALVLINLGRHPVAVISRMDEKNFGISMLTELVSLTVGNPVDPSSFTPLR